MSFVQVKENIYWDLDRGLLCNVFSTVRGDHLLFINDQRTTNRIFECSFSTLEEAIAAQVRIIESCEKSKATEVDEVFKPHYKNGFDAGFHSMDMLRRG